MDEYSLRACALDAAVKMALASGKEPSSADLVAYAQKLYDFLTAPRPAAK